MQNSEAAAASRAKQFNYLVGMRTIYPMTYDNENKYQEYEIAKLSAEQVSNGFDVYITLKSRHGIFDVHNKQLHWNFEYFKQNWVIVRRIELGTREVKGQDQIVVTIPKNAMGREPYFVFSGGGSPLYLNSQTVDKDNYTYEKVFNADPSLNQGLLGLPDGFKAIVEYDGVKYQSNIYNKNRKKTVFSRS